MPVLHFFNFNDLIADLRGQVRSLRSLRSKIKFSSIFQFLSFWTIFMAILEPLNYLTSDMTSEVNWGYWGHWDQIFNFPQLLSFWTIFMAILDSLKSMTSIMTSENTVRSPLWAKRTTYIRASTRSGRPCERSEPRLSERTTLPTPEGRAVREAHASNRYYSKETKRTYRSVYD